jgi:BirA family biotin operon repressor/biotin-[acetyl-CoA-carboxylase] ligase
VKSRLKIADMLFGAEDYISGEELGRELGVSRTAVWKQIQGLESEGFIIEAKPRLGYRVVSYPDKLLPLLLEKRLTTSVMGRNVFYYQAIGSTNSVARSLAEQGAVEGSVVIAEEQTGGRGRYGRHWISPKGANILASVILRPDVLPHQVPRLAILGAVSVAESIHKVIGMKTQLKWPHEILLNGKKVGGILTEFSADLDQVDFVILGIGINVNFDFSGFPELAGEATSLSDEAGAKVSRLELLRVLLEQIEANYELMKADRFNQVVEQWNSQCWGVGDWVQIASVEGKQGGILKRIDDDGCLIIAKVDGEQKVAMSGGISLSKG